MSVPLVELAKAVVTALNAHTFTVAVVSVRGYQPTKNLKDLVALAVTVVPRGDDTTPRARGSDTAECKIDVAVQKKLAGNDEADLTVRLAAADALMSLVDEIKRFLTQAVYALSGLGNWTCVGIANDPAYDPAHWKELGVFTSVVTLTFRGTRSIA